MNRKLRNKILAQKEQELASLKVSIKTRMNYKAELEEDIKALKAVPLPKLEETELVVDFPEEEINEDLTDVDALTEDELASLQQSNIPKALKKKLLEDFLNSQT